MTAIKPPRLSSPSEIELSREELSRLREIAELRLGESVDEGQLQLIVERAAQELGLPVAAVSVVLDRAQYFIASHGLQGWIEQARGTPSEWAFCRTTVDRGAPYLVEDARANEATQDNPLVHQDKVRAYLGIPLITSREQAIGALCVISSERHRFSMYDVGRLTELADELLPLLEARRVASA